MKRVFLVLVFGLGMVFLTGQSAWSGTIPFEFYDGPSGDGGIDDDHPWGGDRIIGGGDADQKYTAVSITTNYTLLDAVFARFIMFVGPQSLTVSTKSPSLVPTTTTADTSVRSTNYRRPARSHAKGVAY